MIDSFAIDKKISVPYISIYDNVLSSLYINKDNKVASDYYGKFYEDMDEFWDLFKTEQ